MADVRVRHKREEPPSQVSRLWLTNARMSDAPKSMRRRAGFGKQRLAKQRYQAGQIDVPIWAEEIENDYLGWCEEQGLSATRRG